MKIKTIITSKKDNYEIIFKIHDTKNVGDRKLEKYFYAQYSTDKKVFTGLHHEIEIVSPDFSKYPHFEKMHIHISKDSSKPFICNIFQVKTKKHLTKILEMWATGTVYTIVTGMSFDNLMTSEEAKNEEYARVLKVLKDDYGITATFEKMD